MTKPEWLLWARQQFPALARTVDGRRATFLDGPAGSQVPLSVADAVRRYLLESNANTHGVFATSVESDALIAAAREAVTDFLGARDADEIVFGANMTTLTFSLARALAREWSPGDEIVLTRLDHDANVTPWVGAAQQAGAVVRWAPVRPADATLDVEALRAALSPRTRLVAVTAASNATGSLTPIANLAHWAHEVGAELFVDAVHLAPHRRLDVASWDCDFLVCSAYKFFAPHVGVLWAPRSRLAALRVDKVRPAPDAPPERLETGTQSHEGIAGVGAAVEYLAELGRTAANDSELSRPAALDAAFATIHAHETDLARRLLGGIAELTGARVWGITDPARLHLRTPTVAMTHEALAAHDLAGGLAARGVFSWSGSFYAVELIRALGLEPDGVLRLGLLHYNDEDDVDRCLAALREVIR